MHLTKKQCEALGIGKLFPKTKTKVAAKGKRKPAHVRKESFCILAAGQSSGATSWTIEIPGWTPPSLNSLLYKHWSVARRTKRAAMDVVAGSCLEAGVTRAIRRRRVSIAVTVKQRSHMLDGDNVPKSVLDAMKHAGAIVDDSAEWCELAPVEVRVGDRRGTVIFLEELGDNLEATRVH